MLSASIVRTLGQKEYDKRKQAALEVENMIRDLSEAGDFDKISGIIHQLASEQAESPVSNVRKPSDCARIVHSSTLKYMRWPELTRNNAQDVGQFLAQLLPPVLSSFTDQDARVRYYSCEALYNIAKVARASCVAHFNSIFDGLFKLEPAKHGRNGSVCQPLVIPQVQNGMQLLDRLLKDIVTESDNFEIESFMPLLGERIYVSNPFSRQFLVGWIATLDSVPDIELLQATFHSFLSRRSALLVCPPECRACSPSAAQHLPIFFDGLFHMLADPNKEIRQQTFSVLQEFLREIRDAESVAYAPIVHVLVQHSASQDKFSRLSAISWLHTFVSHGREKILPFCAQVLNAILSSLSHSEEEIREAAGRADNTLRTLLQQSQDAQFDMQTLLHALSSHLASQYVPTLVASLEWVHMLLRKSASRVMQLSQQIWPALFGCLTNASEEVVRLDIEALARMAPNQLHFTPLIDHLLKLFKSERNLLEGRGALIVRQLCVLLDPHNVFETLAGGLEHEEDLDFASQMIQMLNLILLTSQEAMELRILLKKPSDGAPLFRTIYPAWSHNPVSLLSLCLFTQAFEHAAELVVQFSNFEMTLPFLVQIDKLVQSPAFHTLKNRLVSVPEIGLLRLQLQHQGRGKISEVNAKDIDFKGLLKTYQEVQEKHRKSLLKQHQGRRIDAA
ncbi:MAG: hypothetical protein SGPRY_005015 [Prymnesium sp.]